jgi:hypothetical protein
MDRHLSSASPLKRLFVRDNHLIEHLATDIGHESFGVRILPRQRGAMITSSRLFIPHPSPKVVLSQELLVI